MEVKRRKQSPYTRFSSSIRTFQKSTPFKHTIVLLKHTVVPKVDAVQAYKSPPHTSLFEPTIVPRIRALDAHACYPISDRFTQAIHLEHRNDYAYERSLRTLLCKHIIFLLGRIWVVAQLRVCLFLLDVFADIELTAAEVPLARFTFVIEF